MLDVVEINRDSPYIEDAFYIMHDQFPEPEWEPVEQVLGLIDQDPYTYRLRGYLDDGEFVGFSFVIDSYDHPFCYLTHLGVDARYQSCGYGSKMLADICEEAGRPLAFSIESIDETDAPNYDQRIRRYNFYVRNGFADTGATIYDCDVNYNVLCDDASIEVPQVDAFAEDFPRLVGR